MEKQETVVEKSTDDKYIESLMINDKLRQIQGDLTNDKNASIFKEINLSDTRGKDETYEEFKSRRKINKMMMKQYLRGRVIWDGKQGTKHGS